LGGIGYVISQKIIEKIKIEIRCTVLGYIKRWYDRILRCGTSIFYDKILATK